MGDFLTNPNRPVYRDPPGTKQIDEPAAHISAIEECLYDVRTGMGGIGAVAAASVAENVICAADADATAVRTALLATLASLKASGQMAADPVEP